MLPARGRRGAGSSRGDGGLSVSGAAGGGRTASAARAASARKAGFLRYTPRRARARESRPPPAPRRSAIPATDLGGVTVLKRGSADPVSYTQLTLPTTREAYTSD